MRMTSREKLKNMTATPTDSPWPLLRRAARTIVVVDVVESVRLIEQDEDGTIHRWQSFVRLVQDKLLPAHGGRLVKSLGDGLLVEFETVPPAIQCALAMQQSMQEINVDALPDACLRLRVGVHAAEVVVDSLDIYGSGVNLASRIAALARPGDIVVSAKVRDQLIDGLDAEVEDLGECYFKHVSEPMRAFRIQGPRPGRPLPDAPLDARELRTTVAVLPFRARIDDDTHLALGDLMMDEVVCQLTRTPFLDVISRLSTAALVNRNLPLAETGHRLGSDYIVSGTFTVSGDRLRLHVELAQVQQGLVVWIEAFNGSIADVLAGSDPTPADIAAKVASSIIDRELEVSINRPLPTLQSHRLLMAGIGLIHRAARSDFHQAYDVLEHLASRHARLPHAHAWLGKWHAMNVVQGLAQDPMTEARRALDKANRALDADPRSSLALTMKGLVHGFMLKDLDEADRLYASALDINPNEALAWLYVGTLRSWQGRGEEAWQAAERALHLSPLDPMRYYFDSLAGFAAMTAGRHERARELSLRSLKTNRLHTATYRTLAISQWCLGQTEAARRTMSEMLAIEPGFTVGGYLSRFPGGASDRARENAEILRQAGAPG